jgi:preprotein translocase subunit SecG
MLQWLTEKSKSYVDSLFFENTELKKSNILTILTVVIVMIFILITIIINGSKTFQLFKLKSLRNQSTPKNN